jgi:hypothetical protein
VTEDLGKLEQSRQRILGLVVQDLISEEKVAEQLGKLKEREHKLEQERTRLDDKLAHIPDKDAIAAVAKRVAEKFKYVSAKLWAKAKCANLDFEGMPYDERRALCEMVFSGETADGRRMGVWVTWKGRRWTYSIEGHLIEGSGPLGKGCFEFGAASDQKALVDVHALRTRCTLRPRSL